MLIYPVKLQDDEGTTLVTFPDVPEAITYGDTEPEARKHAVDALEAIFMAYIEDKRPIPMPSQPRGRSTIALPGLVGAKIAIYNAMLTKRVSKTDLAERLNCHLPQIDRLLDLYHASRFDQIERALAALGLALHMDVRKAA